MAEAPKKKVKMLLVEDEKMLADMYTTKFTMEGFDAQKAYDGAAGVELAKKFLPDIIMMDVIMPKLDGFAALKLLKEEATTKNIPVVLLTNLGQDEDVKKGKQLGAVDYFVKANHTPAEVVVKAKQVLGIS